MLTCTAPLTLAPEIPGASVVKVVVVLCPRCGTANRAVVLGPDYGCGRCGAAWPVQEPVLPRPRDPYQPPQPARPVVRDEQDRHAARRLLDVVCVPTGRHAAGEYQ